MPSLHRLEAIAQFLSPASSPRASLSTQCFAHAACPQRTSQLRALSSCRRSARRRRSQPLCRVVALLRAAIVLSHQDCLVVSRTSLVASSRLLASLIPRLLLAPMTSRRSRRRYSPPIPLYHCIERFNKPNALELVFDALIDHKLQG